MVKYQFKSTKSTRKILSASSLTDKEMVSDPQMAHAMLHAVSQYGNTGS
jgi:hypothetical protein